ncbi:MAG: chromosomal replication initiator protein DnaA [Bacteroidales bacterium]|nr:chromosomal replication initiator protein DnaA [Bacteroidales bacterium]MDD6732402.1 chromosomal replication initiator protein DnaA [Bacteroidales bacterium]MDY4557774.1 chromosomal replication initiator protein DnaA [Alloprevotella sp.]
MSQSDASTWQECLNIIRKTVPEQHFNAWFEPLEFVRCEDGMLLLCVPNKFFYDYFDRYYAVYLVQAMKEVYGTGVQLKYMLKPDKPENKTNEPILKTGPATVHKNALNTVQHPGELPPIDPQLNPRYTFDNFVEGASNKLPRSVGISIADTPGKSTFNPFFLYGPSGVGKTHLVNAIGVRIRELYPEKRVLFVSAHVFKTQYTDSVIHNTQNDFINFYQTIDVLIIDDIQEITTAKTQQSFFHIFNHLQQNNRQIIITCDRPPVELEGMEERMLTRFKWGMTAELEKPDTQLRRDILISKIRKDGLVIPPEVVQYIARNVESSVRELEGIINSIMAYSVVDNCEIDLQLTQRIVARAVNLEKKELVPDDIIAAVCKRYGHKQKELASKSRKQSIVQSRQLAMYLIHKYTESTYSQLGRLFGKRDHSTVLYACNQTARRISVDKAFRREVEELEAALK